jgi:hypothetical protein
MTAPACARALTWPLLASLCLASLAATAGNPPLTRLRPRACAPGEQPVRVQAYEDRGASVHVELVDLPSGRPREPIDVAKPGHRFYERRFSKVGALACLPRDEAPAAN